MRNEWRVKGEAYAAMIRETMEGVETRIEEVHDNRRRLVHEEVEPVKSFVRQRVDGGTEHSVFHQSQHIGRNELQDKVWLEKEEVERTFNASGRMS